MLSPSKTIMDIVISNVTLVDNGMGIMPLIYAPPSLSHAYANKTVHVQVLNQSSPMFCSCFSIIYSIIWLFSGFNICLLILS